MALEVSLTVTEVSPEEMLALHSWPYFGYTFMQDYLDRNGIVQRKASTHLLSTLPPRARASVLAHETYHARDEYFFVSSVLWREAKANWAGFTAEPRGFLQAIWLSVTDKERLRLYWERVTKNF